MRGPLHGVPIAIKEEIDVAGTVTTFGGEANSTPAAADAEVVRRLRAAGAVVVGKTTMPEFGAFPFTESTSRGDHPQPVGPRPAPPAAPAAVRRSAVASGMVPVGDRRGRRRVDPDPQRELRAVRPQAAAWPGHDRTAPAPVVGARHGRAADPHASSTARIVYDAIRGNTDTDLYRAGGDAPFVEAVGPRAGPAADRLVDRSR